MAKRLNLNLSNDDSQSAMKNAYALATMAEQMRTEIQNQWLGDKRTMTVEEIADVLDAMAEQHAALAATLRIEQVRA